MQHTYVHINETHLQTIQTSPKNIIVHPSTSNCNNSTSNPPLIYITSRYRSSKNGGLFPPCSKHRSAKRTSGIKSETKDYINDWRSTCFRLILLFLKKIPIDIK